MAVTYAEMGKIQQMRLLHRAGLYAPTPQIQWAIDVIAREAQRGQSLEPQTVNYLRIAVRKGFRVNLDLERL